MKNFNITFTNPWFLLLLIPLLILTLIPFLRLPKKRKIKPKYYLPVIFRTLAILIIVFLLSGLSFISSSDKITTLVLADLSDSTLSVRDGIEQYINEIANYSDDSNEIGVIAFAENNVYQIEITQNCEFNGFTKVPVSNASNIDEALIYAGSLLDNNENGRIVLLSDGNETKGDACKTALAMANSNLRIDAVYFDTENQGGKEVMINNVTLPANAKVGETYDIDVSLKSSCDSSGKIMLYDGDKLVSEQKIDIITGDNNYSFTDTAKTSGIHSYMVKIDSEDDSLEQNNIMYSYIKVLGEENILIVDGTGSESSYLASLIGTIYNTEIVSPSGVPSTLTKLRNYDEVILMNVNNDDLPNGYDKLLEEYASKLGRSVLSTGGDNTYHYGNMEDSAFKDFLPVNVNLDDNDEGETEALMILIDNSSSMTGEFIETAKEAAINTINSLDENSSVGVIAFSRYANVLYDLTPISNKNEVISSVENLQTVQGTYLYDAVYEASKQLKNCSADIKHVIILSDGTPRDSGYDNVIGDMYASGITTSTILIGYEGNTEILMALAELGGGRFYNVYDIGELSDTLLDESNQAKESYLNTGDFELKICDYSKVLSDIDELSNVKGFITTKIKAGASNVLYTQNNMPIYAEWNYGSGKVASFTSDMSGEWSQELLANEKGRKFILNVVECLLPSSGGASGLKVNIDNKGLETNIEVESANTDEKDKVEVSSLSQKGEVSTVSLVRTDSGTYKGVLDTFEEGLYTLTVTQYDENGDIYDSTEEAVAASYSQEYNTFLKGGYDKLNNICTIGNGSIFTTTSSLMDITMNDLKTSKSFYLILSVLAFILLVADLVLRNTKWSFWQKLWGKVVNVGTI